MQKQKEGAVRNNKRMWLLVMISLQLNACAVFDFSKFQLMHKQTVDAVQVPEKWHATLPHDGKVENLASFWAQYDDATLLHFIESAQTASESIAAAKTRIAEAKSNRVSTRANTLPTIDGSISASRSVQQPELVGTGGQAQFGSLGGQTATNNYSVGAQAAWELDVFGANSVLLNAAERQLSATEADWHEARVSVAAETATAYFNQRFCQLQQAVLMEEVQSLSDSLKATEASIRAGFSAEATGNLASASLANAKLQLNTQEASCAIGIKELVALTALTEEEVRNQLASQTFVSDMTVERLSINQLPADVIKQRPDIYSAEAALVNAAANIAGRKAAKYPRVALNGSIGWLWLTGVGFKGDGEVWSLGPVTVTLPLYDGGKRQAKLEATEVAYEESAQRYRSKVRHAVKEVETALVNLHSAKTKREDLDVAVKGYRAAFKATEIKVNAGFANLIELEESRRFALQAEINRLNVQQSSYNAWISLYRAVGGGWTAKHQTSASNE